MNRKRGSRLISENKGWDSRRLLRKRRVFGRCGSSDRRLSISTCHEGVQFFGNDVPNSSLKNDFIALHDRSSARWLFATALFVVRETYPLMHDEIARRAFANSLGVPCDGTLQIHIAIGVLPIPCLHSGIRMTENETHKQTSES